MKALKSSNDDEIIMLSLISLHNYKQAYSISNNSSFLNSPRYVANSLLSRKVKLNWLLFLGNNLTISTRWEVFKLSISKMCCYKHKFYILQTHYNEHLFNNQYRKMANLNRTHLYIYENLLNGIQTNYLQESICKFHVEGPWITND